MKEIRLICVEAKNNNKYYNMKEQSDGTFLVEYGRVGVTVNNVSYPMSKWDSKYREKIKKGYKDVSEIFVESSKEKVDFIDIQDSVIKGLVDVLQSYANTSVSSNYLVGAGEVTQKQIEEAQKIIDELSTRVLNNNNINVNRYLLDLYKIIPRKMKNVKNHIIPENNKFDESLKLAKSLLSNEQDLLDTMKGQVRVNQVSHNEKNNTLLDAIGIEIIRCDDDEIYRIKNMMNNVKDNFQNSFKINNIKTRDRFESFVSSKRNKKTELLWHGSRNQNWWNILDSGLMIRPSNAIHTGSMFGCGIYFANKARKSLGYTSLHGSYWASGNDNKGFLALYNVHVGNQYITQRHQHDYYNLNEQNLKKYGDYDSVYAKGGADLRNDEFIVYNTAQSTIEYLIETH